MDDGQKKTATVAAVRQFSGLPNPPAVFATLRASCAWLAAASMVIGRNAQAA